MPWYGFIHPLLAIGTLAVGLVTGQVSLTNINDWNFPMRRMAPTEGSANGAVLRLRRMS